MGYMNINSRKASEVAHKTNHSYIINDPEVQKFLKDCENIPREVDPNDLKQSAYILDFEALSKNPISNIIAVDGGYTEVDIQKTFPSSRMAYFQFGALWFDLEHLEHLEEKPFLFPEDMAKFKDLERIKLVVPTRNISYKLNNLTDSVRKALLEFFEKDRSGERFMDSLIWFIFREYDQAQMQEEYQLASCPSPSCRATDIALKRSEFSKKRVSYCPNCGKEIYLTDVFRLHEAIDEEHGAGGILGYLTTTLEHMIIIHLIKYLLKRKPDLLKSILFIKDGPLGFFGQTANMHKPMRDLCNFLEEHYQLHLVGLEKSGAFAEHADFICSPMYSKEKEPLLAKGKVLMLSNEYIYKNVIPGIPDPRNPYASTSYYSSKLIFHTPEGHVYVMTLPAKDKFVVNDPKKADFKNLDVVMHNLRKLRCDMYENSLVPIALVNQVVSLANRPSSVLLEKFSREGVK